MRVTTDVRRAACAFCVSSALWMWKSASAHFAPLKSCLPFARNAREGRGEEIGGGEGGKLTEVEQHVDQRERTKKFAPWTSLRLCPPSQRQANLAVFSQPKQANRSENKHFDGTQQVVQKNSSMRYGLWLLDERTEPSREARFLRGKREEAPNDAKAKNKRYFTGY
eukprot:1090149-Rhodomonas_salina.1